MQTSRTPRTHWPWWPAAVLVVALAAVGWWAFHGAATTAPAPTTVHASRAEFIPTSICTSLPVAAPAPDAASFAPAFKLVGTVMAADRASSFAMVRRTADSQLMQLRAGDRVEGWLVSAIEPDSIVLAGAAQAVVIETDRTVAGPAPLVLSRAPPPPQDAAWAGDPAPFGH